MYCTATQLKDLGRHGFACIFLLQLFGCGCEGWCLLRLFSCSLVRARRPQTHMCMHRLTKRVRRKAAKPYHMQPHSTCSQAVKRLWLVAGTHALAETLTALERHTPRACTECSNVEHRRWILAHNTCFSSCSDMQHIHRHHIRSWLKPRLRCTHVTCEFWIYASKDLQRISQFVGTVHEGSKEKEEKRGGIKINRHLSAMLGVEVRLDTWRSRRLCGCIVEAHQCRGRVAWFVTGGERVRRWRDAGNGVELRNRNGA